MTDSSRSIRHKQTQTNMLVQLQCKMMKEKATENTETCLKWDKCTKNNRAKHKKGTWTVTEANH